MKKTIRLTESELHNIVKSVVNEISFDKAQRAYLKSVDPERTLSPAMQRRLEKNSMGAAQQISSLKQGASNSFNREYGYNLKNVPYGSGDDYEMDVDDESKPYYGGRNYYAPNPNDDHFAEFAGKKTGDDEYDTMYSKTTGIRNNPISSHISDDDTDMSVKDTVTHPGLAMAVKRGRKAVQRAHNGLTEGLDEAVARAIRKYLR